MSWSREQNPTGYAMPATNVLQVTPITGRALEDAAQAALIARSGIRTDANAAPIAANARKADGWTPLATTPVV